MSAKSCKDSVYSAGEKTAHKAGEKNTHAVNLFGYSRIPDTVWRDQGLSASAIRVYAVLARKVKQGTVCTIGERLLSRITGLHRQTVRKALGELEKREHLTIKGKGIHRRVYVLASPVFGQKQGKADVLVSKPDGRRRLVSVKTA